MPRTLKLTIAYDGTNYAGWQRQINAHRHPAGPRGRDRGDRRRAQSAERRRPHRRRRARRRAGGEHHDRSSDPVRRTAARAQRAAEGRRHSHPIDRGDARSLGRAHLRESQDVSLCDLERRRAEPVLPPRGVARAAARSISIACSAPRRRFSASTTSPRSRAAAATCKTTVRRVLSAEIAEMNIHTDQPLALSPLDRRADDRRTGDCCDSRSAAPDFCVTWCAPSSARWSTSGAATWRSTRWRAIIESRDRTRGGTNRAAARSDAVEGHY